MMGRGHAVSGAAVGLLAVQALQAGGQHVPLTTAAACAAVCAGAALLPDIDHPGATVSRVFGPPSQWLAELVAATSERVYGATKTELDDDRDGGHRGLTHTLVFAAGAGAVAALGATTWVGRLVILFLFLALAARGLLGKLARRQGWIGTTLLSGLAAWAVLDWVPAERAPLYLGVAVGLGSLTHCLGDSLTRSGCPWLWPVLIAGQRWYPVGTPEAIRFHTGKRAETWVVTPLLTLAAALLAVGVVPGAWSTVAEWLP